MTDAFGRYEFTGIANDDYWVAVDSVTVTPSSGLNAPFTQAAVWAEQTYGPENSVMFDGVSTYTFTPSRGPFYGGKQSTVGDAAATLLGAEHVATAALLGTAVVNVDFGFSFNVVTTTNAATAAVVDGRSAQGSFDQFIRNANAVTGANAMRMVPVVPQNDGTGSWWRIDYAGAPNPLADIFDAGTTIDGTAFNATDGTTVVNSNSGFLGANAGGGVTVGTASTALSQVAKPELEIKDESLRLSQAQSPLLPNNTEIRDLSIWGSATSIHALTGASSLSGLVFDGNVVGTPPDAFVDPATVSPNYGIRVYRATGTQVTNNLIGFVNYTPLLLETSTSGATVSGNEIRSGGRTQAAWDGLLLWGTGDTVDGNLIADNGAMGIDVNATVGGHTIENNTVQNSGLLGTQTAGLRIKNHDNTVRFNVFQNNAGPGISVEGGAGAALRNLLSQNEYATNGGLSIDLALLALADDLGDGVNPNDAATNVTHGNEGLDHPVITSAQHDGVTTTVDGTTCGVCRVEVYRVVGGAGDAGPGGDHGEGVEYLGFTSANPAGDFSFATTLVGLADEVSAIAIDGSNDTSEFGANVTVVPAQTITGTVFEDVVGDALAVGALADADNPAVPGVTVSLYRDGGDGIPDGGDDGAPIATTATNASGQFTFGSLPSDLYWVTIDSLGVAPSAGLQNPTPQAGLITVTGTDDTWAEQTYGPVGAVAESGASYTYAAGAGPFYGGKTPTGADGPGLGGSEHIARVDFPGGATGTDIDFGFSFQVVTNLEAGDSTDVGVDDRVYQGSFRQFQRNAGAIIGRNDMRFVPVVPTNGTNGVDTWWILDVSERLMLNYDAFTILDGTAYDAGNPFLVLDTNTASVGTGNGTGVLGAITTPTLNPELELRGDGVVQTGLSMDPGAHNSVIRNFAVTGFPTYGIIVTGPAATPIDNALVERNVLGTAAGAMADSPATKLGNFGISLQQTTNSQASNNVIAYVGGTGIRTISSADAWIHRNEILQADVYGIYTSEAFGTDAGRQTISNNDIVASGYTGVSLNDSWGGHTITSNTISGSGRLTSVNEVGIRVGPSNNLIVLNRIAGNGGSGVTVAGGATPSIGNEITQNRFGGNGLIAIDLVPSGGSSWAGEGITPNDGATNPTSGNLELDFPVVDFVDAATGTVSGTACAACDVELYIAVADGDASDDDGSGRGHGEGITFLVRIPQDGSPAWSTTGLSFLTSEAISAIAIDGGGNTSEFSRNAATNVAPTLDPVGDRSTDELVNLSFTATASDTNAGDTLTFSLSGEPVGASITAGGVFSWTPTEAQGPGSYSFDVVVTDDGNPALE